MLGDEFFNASGFDFSEIFSKFRLELFIRYLELSLDLERTLSLRIGSAGRGTEIILLFHVLEKVVQSDRGRQRISHTGDFLEFELIFCVFDSNLAEAGSHLELQKITACIV